MTSIFFVRTNPNRTGQYMSITRLSPDQFLMIRDDSDIVFHPEIILNRIQRNQPLNVLRAHIRSMAQMMRNMATIQRNYIEIPGIPRTVNSRRRRRTN